MWKARITAILLATAFVAASLGSCSQIREFTEVADTITQDLPSSRDTLTSMVEINSAVTEAMSRGETELTFNAAEVDEDDLRAIGTNLSTFWGKPVLYTINREFKEIEGIIPGKAVDVKNITNSFVLSNNFYVYDYIRNGTPIPEDKLRAQRIADALPEIAAEIFTDPAMTDYEKVLSAHDWLVANIEYDDTMPSESEENGSYGAIVLKRTMCQGYAEALELLLKCYTDVEIVQIVGEAISFTNDPGVAETEGDLDTDGTFDTDETGFSNEQEGAWGGHAWNIVKLDGVWYHIDPTFDDPKDNVPGRVSHIYFGQTDEIMLQNHNWTREYFPKSGSEDFLFFKKSELYAVGWDEFVFVLTASLTEAPVEFLEIATRDVIIDNEDEKYNLQFIFQSRSELDEIWWSVHTWEDTKAIAFEFFYTS